MKNFKEGFKKLFLRRKSALVGLILCVLILLAAIGAPLLTSYTPDAMNVDARLMSPSSANFMGTDEFGRDLFSRVLFGARNSLLTAFLIVIFAVGFGVIAGILAGFYPKLDSLIMRIMDGLMAFPGIVLAIAMMGAMGPSMMNVIISLGIVYTPRIARVVRSYILTVRESPYIEAARSIGAKDIRIITRHILPNCISPIVVQASFIFSYAILGEAALSFLGVGIPATMPSWGNILSDGRVFMQIAPWLTLYPGLVIMITVLGLNMIGDGIRDYFDPRLRKQ